MRGESKKKMERGKKISNGRKLRKKETDVERERKKGRKKE